MLVEKYPRPSWEAHPHFTELTRFWLEMHLGFRRCRACSLTETEGFLDRAREPRAYAGGLARVAGQFLNELHGHHNIEDHHYFPLLKALDARIGWGLRPARRRPPGDGRGDPRAGRGDQRRARGGARRRAGGGGGRGAAPRLAGFGRLLDRHLIDEEELVVPVILDNPGAVSEGCSTPPAERPRTPCDGRHKRAAASRA